MCQTVRSLALTVCEVLSLEDLEEKDDSLDEGVCRTTPATQSLVNTGSINSQSPSMLGRHLTTADKES